MSDKKLKKSLSTHIKNKNFITIIRGFKNDTFSSIAGYILAYSNDFIMIAYVDEFHFFGFNCIPIESITNIRRNKNDEYYGMIFEKEFPKIFKKITKKENIIDISSFETIFKNLQMKKECVIVECERQKHQYFSIGNIQKVSSKNVTIEYFNAQGYLEKPSREKFKQITKIAYQDNYSNTFKKYTRS